MPTAIELVRGRPYDDAVVDPNVPAYSPIQLRVDPALAPRLAELAHGRPLLIDHFASRRCAVTIGDLRARFGDEPAGTGATARSTDFAEIEPLGEIPVLIERSLLEVMSSGAELRLGGPFFAAHLAVELDRPEAWLAFLESHPANRR